MEQTIGQLEEMQKWLADAKQAELSALINELREVQQEYAKSSLIRNQFSTRKKVERVAQKVRNGFSAKNVLPYRE